MTFFRVIVSVFCIILLNAGMSAADPIVEVILKDDVTSTILRSGDSELVVRASARLPVEFGVDSEFVFVDGRPYRGSVRVENRRRGKIRVINRLDLEDYLRGVVPSEMPAHWPLEALKAQAVAARTYASHRLGLGGPLQSTVLDQVYKGVRFETDSTNAAIDQTRGIVLTFEGDLFMSYFHSACGGTSELASSVWPGAGVSGPFEVAPDSYCGISPHGHWTWRVSTGRLGSLLKPITGRSGLERIEIGECNISGRVSTFVLSYRGGVRRRIDGQRLRMAVDPQRLKSLLCEVEMRKGEAVFRGAGWGHGVGLCQWGANGMAQQGSSFLEILAKYYPRAAISVSQPRWPG